MILSHGFFTFLHLSHSNVFNLFQFTEKLSGKMSGGVNNRNNPNFVCLFKKAVNDPVVENVDFTIAPGFYFRDKCSDFGKTFQTLNRL